MIVFVLGIHAAENDRLYQECTVVLKRFRFHSLMDIITISVSVMLVILVMEDLEDVLLSQSLPTDCFPTNRLAQ